MTKIEKITQYLGIKIGTQFKIKKDSEESDTVYKFNETELLYEDNNGWHVAPLFTIFYLITGIYQIILQSH